MNIIKQLTLLGLLLVPAALFANVNVKDDDDPENKVVLNQTTSVDQTNLENGASDEWVAAGRGFGGWGRGGWGRGWGGYGGWGRGYGYGGWGRGWGYGGYGGWGYGGYAAYPYYGYGYAAWPYYGYAAYPYYATGWYW